MSRPTEEVKSHIVKSRIGDSLYSKINGNVSEVIREALESYVSHSNVKQNLSAEAQAKLNDLIGMIRVSKGSADEFFIDLHEKIESGEWGIRDSRLDAVGEEEEVNLPFA